MTIEEKIDALLKLAANPKTPKLERQLALSYVQLVTRKALAVCRELNENESISWHDLSDTVVANVRTLMEDPKDDEKKS